MNNVLMKVVKYILASKIVMNTTMMMMIIIIVIFIARYMRL